MAIAFSNPSGSGTSVDRSLEEVADRLRQSNVQVTCRGTGAIWHSDGLIITNAHVVPSDRATVRLPDGRSFAAVRTAFDPRRDLAALRIEATNLTAAAIADSDALRVGQLVLAVGNPHHACGVGEHHQHSVQLRGGGVCRRKVRRFSRRSLLPPRVWWFCIMTSSMLWCRLKRPQFAIYPHPPASIDPPRDRRFRNARPRTR